MDWVEGARQVLGIGAEAKDLSVLNVCARAAVVFPAAIALVRIANRRFLAKLSAFDVILGFVMASMLSRSINGSSPLLPTLAGCLALVITHRAVATLSFHVHWFGLLVKGSASNLVRQGHPDDQALRKHKISPQDLLEEARLKGNVNDIARIDCAFLERSGEVSVILRRDES